MPLIYRNLPGLIVLLLAGIQLGCNQVDRAVSDPLPSCFDGILNQGELAIDCGGPCLPCDSKMSASVNGTNWQSQGTITSQVNGNSIFISGGNSTSTISLIYTGPFVNGSYQLSGGLYSENLTGVNYISNGGNITFVDWDNQNNVVSGSFSFTAYESTGTGDSVVVNSGTFLFVPF